ncbi:MAG: response regulator [Candidatus Nealsonbacteria bacterium]|nr:response regulator [Candidatus Nealsonbacteria bacterium]
MKNDFMRKTYFEVFQAEGFQAFKTNNGKEVLDLAKKETPNIILLDVALSEMDGFRALEALKKDTSTQKIPVIMYAQLEKKEDRAKAIELEARDFITAAEVTPLEAINRIKIILGEQRSYRVAINKNDGYDIKEFIEDLIGNKVAKCPKCGSDLILHLIKDLSKGPDYFKVSFICPKCA